MADTTAAELVQLYDESKTKKQYPLTKVKAVYDENGTRLDALLDLILQYAKEYADTKIIEAILGNQVDLSGYATKTYVTQEINRAINEIADALSQI